MVAAGEMYLDSAIIVKLLIREPDSEFFDAALSGHALDSSELCLTGPRQKTHYPVRE